MYTHLMRVRPDRDTERPGQAEVSELELVVCTVYEQVLGLEVAVQDPAKATECDVDSLPLHLADSSC